MLLKHMDQLNLVPENKTRPKMANYVLLSFGSDGGLNQPNGTGREQMIFNGKRRGPLNGMAVTALILNYHRDSSSMESGLGVLFPAL